MFSKQRVSVYVKRERMNQRVSIGVIGIQPSGKRQSDRL